MSVIQIVTRQDPEEFAYVEMQFLGADRIVHYEDLTPTEARLLASRLKKAARLAEETGSSGEIIDVDFNAERDAFRRGTC